MKNKNRNKIKNTVSQEENFDREKCGIFKTKLGRLLN